MSEFVEDDVRSELTDLQYGTGEKERNEANADDVMHEEGKNNMAIDDKGIFLNTYFMILLYYFSYYNNIIFFILNNSNYFIYFLAQLFNIVVIQRYC